MPSPLPDPALLSREEVVGKSPQVDDLARNWSEEAFCLSRPRPGTPSEVIHRGRDRRMGYLFGEPNRNGTISHFEYAVAQDKSLEGRWLLLQRTATADKTESRWGPVGEWHKGNLGVLDAYRGEGAGTAFAAELLRRGVLHPSIGYSPEGLRTFEKAHARVIREAMDSGRPFNEEAAAIYGLSTPQPLPAAPTAANREICFGYTPRQR